MRVIMLSDERIRQIAEDIYCSEGTRAEIEHSIRAALAEAAQSPAVPVVGEAVAYLVPCQTMTGDVDMKLSFEPSGAFVGHSVGERVPLYAKPTNYITAAELATLREKAAMADEAHDVLRTLACELGAGGYNAEIVDASVFEHKIRDGVNMLLNPLMNRVSQAEQERDELRKDAELDKERADTHARELRAYEATVQNLEQRIRELEALMVPGGFPSDVMTAAGLVYHGKRDKVLAERLSIGAQSMLAAARR